MDYGTFRPANAGYNTASGPPKTQTAPAGEPLAYADGKEGEFQELLVTNGVGPYHVNHFIGYTSPKALSQSHAFVTRLADWFYRFFVAVFQPNVANATKREYRYKQADTIEFELGGNKEWLNLYQKLGGLFHSDWVSLQRASDGESFYASTLRRGWLLLPETLELAGAGIVDSKARKAVAEKIKVNQHHFLAGRRSFRFGYDENLKRLYVETVAFERSSLCEYRLVEKTGLLRSTIIEIWTNLIENVESAMTLEWADPKSLRESERIGYAAKGNVAYRVAEYETAGEALGDALFLKTLSRHPGLLTGLKL